MAVIDHTVIVWKNGEYMPNPFIFDEDYNYTNLCPFTYNRDGLIMDISGIGSIRDEIKWYRDDSYAYYERAGYHRLFAGRGAGLSGRIKYLIDFLKYKLHMMNRVYYERETGVYKNGDVELYILHDPRKQSYASFYKDATDTYVVLGGYGHYENVYCHFMHRGYGEAFEQKMASEAYQWLCREVLEEITEYIHYDDIDWERQEEDLERLRKMFRKESDANGE